MFQIDYKSRVPFYEQLMKSVKSMVISRVLGPDDPLPSVRQLSGELGINPNTVQKAYASLEQQGVIYTIPGKGNFIRPETDKLRESRIISLMEQLLHLSEQLKALGVSLEEANHQLSAAYKEGTHD